MSFKLKLGPNFKLLNNCPSLSDQFSVGQHLTVEVDLD